MLSMFFCVKLQHDILIHFAVAFLFFSVWEALGSNVDSTLLCTKTFGPDAAV